MKLATSLVPWMALALSICTFSIGTNAVQRPLIRHYRGCALLHQR